jgi:hypothetical protein
MYIYSIGTRLGRFSKSFLVTLHANHFFKISAAPTPVTMSEDSLRTDTSAFESNEEIDPELMAEYQGSML